VGGMVGGAVFGAVFTAVFGVVFTAVFGAVHGKVSGAVRGVVSGAVVGAVRGALLGGKVGAVFGVALYGPLTLVYSLGGLWDLAAYWGLWLAVGSVLYWDARHRALAAANPLHGLLDGVGPAPAMPLRRGGVSFSPLRLFSRRSRNQPGSR